MKLKYVIIVIVAIVIGWFIANIEVHAPKDYYNNIDKQNRIHKLEMKLEEQFNH